jgi:hypothetical protein
MNSATKYILIRFLLLVIGTLGSHCRAGTAPIQVQLLSPTNGTVLRAHQQSTLAASVTALDGFVSRVDFFADSKQFGRVTTPPFSLDFQATALDTGSHTLSVTAVDNRGNVASSDNVLITVLPSAPVVQAVYLVPLDQTYKPVYSNAIYAALTNLQGWYADQLSNATSFRLSSPAVEVYVTPHNSRWYTTTAPGYFYNTLNDGFQLTGGTYPDPDITWIFYLDASAQGQATGGVNGVAVLHQGDLQGLVAEASSTTKRWIGGSGHELGHAFGLPHPPGCQTPTPGVVCPLSALMWLGYTTYPATYLLPADKDILNQNGFFYSPTFAARLFSPSFDSNGFTFNASVQTGWRYQAQSSTNLVSWQPYTNFVSQSSNVQIRAVLPASSAAFRLQFK